ncbi:CubicO group peptidase (beta-lactamase class C family) [Couchioplanes caeruleus]|nr:CubicO group peptidase (beta-lactamase class C family) [Couchioplanes caeruleus]
MEPRGPRWRSAGTAATAVTALCLLMPGTAVAAPDGDAARQLAKYQRTTKAAPGIDQEVTLPPGDPAEAERTARPTRSGRSADCPVSAHAASRFAGFDAVAEDLMDQWNIGSSTLAVSDECSTIYQRGYGLTGPFWLRNVPPPANPLQIFGTPTPANALFRVASVVKPITAAAIHDLDERGMLDKGDRAFCVPGSPANCHVTVNVPANFDTRIRDITVGQMVGHSGGFDRTVTTDYLFRAWETYQARNLSAPPTPRDFAEYMLSLGLDFAPGTDGEYSNLGYLMLGMVIEKVSGMSYRDYVYQRLLAPLGISSADVVLSRGKRLTRDPREVAYWCLDNNWGTNEPISTYPGEAGQRRCFADGGWVHESMAAHGGLSMTANALARFYARWWNFGNPRDGDEYWAFPNPDASAYSHGGSLEAVQTLAARCTNGLNVVWLTNQHAWATWQQATVEQRMCAAADDFLAQGPYYSSIWIKDSGGHVADPDTPANLYQARVDNLRGAGWRLLDVNGYRSRGATYYANTWARGDGTQWMATHGHDFAGFNTRFDQLNDDWRMTKVSGWTDAGGMPRYASVWVANPNDAAWRTHIRMTNAQYQKRVEDYDADGYRLISVDGYELGGQARIAAVWLYDPAGAGAPSNTATPYRAIHGKAIGDYQNWLANAEADGYRLTDKDIYTVGTAVRVAAIATKQPGPDTKSFSDWNFFTWDDNAKLQEDAGWRPVSISGYR